MSLHATPRDPFRERAERDARKRADKAAKKGGQTAAVAGLAVAPAFFNPFARAAPPISPVVALGREPMPDPDAWRAEPVETLDAAPDVEPETRPDAVFVEPAVGGIAESAEPEFAPEPFVAPAQAQAVNVTLDRVVEAEAESVDAPLRAAPVAVETVIREADWVEHPLSPAEPGAMFDPRPGILMASAGADPGPSPISGPKSEAAAPDAATQYWSGAKGGGGPPRGRGFDQDDLVAALILLLLLLLGGWMFLNGMNEETAEDPILEPQMVSAAAAPAPAPAPLADPFGAGPVDLRPSSPAPEDVEAPPASVAEVAPPPATASPPAPTQSCEPGRVVRAYFCTARSDLTPEAQAALDSDLADLKTCAGDSELVVTGYADRRGAETFNVSLGEQRAARLADMLRARGMKVSDVSGVGELTDIEDNQNCANQRRVDVSLKASLAPPSRSCAPPEEAARLACG